MVRESYGAVGRWVARGCSRPLVTSPLFPLFGLTHWLPGFSRMRVAISSSGGQLSRIAVAAGWGLSTQRALRAIDLREGSHVP